MHCVNELYSIFIISMFLSSCILQTKQDYNKASAASAAAIVHRNNFFRLYQREKSSDSKIKFRQASNHCKSVLEAAKL